jgi:hypothetical protein
MTCIVPLKRRRKDHMHRTAPCIATGLHRRLVLKEDLLPLLVFCSLLLCLSLLFCLLALSCQSHSGFLFASHGSIQDASNSRNQAEVS